MYQRAGPAGPQKAGGLPGVRKSLHSGKAARRADGFRRRRLLGLLPIPEEHMTCPIPIPVRDRILLGHGSGGKLSAQLLRDIFLPAFRNPILAGMNDQAVVQFNGSRVAFTTDTFVVKPLFFRGGDIGSLAVHGTVNDLAMGGAQPMFLSVAFIIEEGLSMSTLSRVVDSLGKAAEYAGVRVVTGDTKVVEKGSGDGLFINTTGLGLVPEGIS